MPQASVQWQKQKQCGMSKISDALHERNPIETNGTYLWECMVLNVRKKLLEERNCKNKGIIYDKTETGFMPLVLLPLLPSN